MPIELLDLPHELLSLVAGHLYDPHRLSDLKNFRLLNETCREIGIEQLFWRKAASFRTLHDTDAGHAFIPPSATIAAASRALTIYDSQSASNEHHWVESYLTLLPKLPHVVHLGVRLLILNEEKEAPRLLAALIKDNSIRRSLSIIMEFGEEAPPFHPPGPFSPAAPSTLDRLRLSGAGSTAFFQYPLAPRAGPSVLPMLTSLYLDEIPELTSDDIESIVCAVPTISKLSILDCPRLHLVPLLTAVELHLSSTLVSLLVCRDNRDDLLSSMSVPKYGFSFPKLERLAIQDEENEVSEVDLVRVAAKTVKIITSISAPSLKHFSLDFLLANADDATDQTMRAHFTRIQLFPHLCKLYSELSKAEVPVERLALWLSSSVGRLLVWSNDNLSIQDWFGAGPDPITD